ncbi:hypothetical protein ES703_32049 [subsurface metagenome]
MNGTLQYLIQEELCPNGIWRLTDTVKSKLTYQILRLPKREVSKIGARYPQSPAEMRAFLVKFFTRHYFQVQNCLVNYMTSQDFLDLIKLGHLRILDIGSGPAVAPLAITDMLSCILKHLERLGAWPKGKTIKVSYVLNDTSAICLETGQRMLTDYFRIRRGRKEIINSQIISIQKAFPNNISLLQRAGFNLAAYDIIVFSYVISPLNENLGFSKLVDGLLNIEKLCRPNGRILILQDKFEASLVRRISSAIGTSSNKQVLTQYVYPKRNENEIYTYIYYCCLYASTTKVTARALSVV